MENREKIEFYVVVNNWDELERNFPKNTYNPVFIIPIIPIMKQSHNKIPSCLVERKKEKQ